MLNSSCLTCRSLFENAEMQRDHYKSEWHRYNLKRKILNLFPIDYEIFYEKSKLAGNVIDTTAPLYCKSCNKLFLSNNSFEAHIRSKRHISLQHTIKDRTFAESNHEGSISEMLKTDFNVANEDVKSVHSEKSWDTLSSGSEDIYYKASKGDNFTKNLKCLFCNYMSSSSQAKIEHMTEDHGFFIPYEPKVVNMEEFLTYLSYKLNTCNICLWCDKTFQDTASCQKHISDKGHFKLKFEQDNSGHILEYLQFYTKKNIDDMKDDPSKLAKIINRIFSPVIEIKDDKGVDCNHLSQAMNDTYQIALPSGAVLGHRSLRIYYKQNLSSYGKFANHRKTMKLQKLYASAHLSNLVDKRNQQHSHLITQASKRITKRDIKRDRKNFLRPYKLYHRQQLRLMMKANNQKHYRVQVEF